MVNKNSKSTVYSVKKYTEALKQFIIETSKEERVVITRFISKYNLNANFPYICKDLGYVDKTGICKNTRYFPLMKSEDVDPFHGRKIADEIINININSWNKLNEKLDKKKIVTQKFLWWKQNLNLNHLI